MEFPHVGGNCDFPECNQYEFLPHICKWCNHLFCSTHRHQEGSCPKYTSLLSQKIADNDIPASDNFIKCLLPFCTYKTMQLKFLSRCTQCLRYFCEEHVTPSLHKCEALVLDTPALPLPDIRHRPPPPPQQILYMDDSKIPKTLRLTKLKAVAIGNKDIPKDKRVYFYVRLPLEAMRAESYPIYVHEVETLGKLLDSLAQRYNIINYNNDPLRADKKLVAVSTLNYSIIPLQVSIIQLISEKIISEADCIYIERQNVVSQYLK